MGDSASVIPVWVPLVGAVVIAAAIAAWLCVRSRLLWRQGAAITVAVAGVVLVIGSVHARRAAQDADRRVRLVHAIPDVALDNVGAYATSDRCRACHPGAYDTWHDSWHRTMTQAATPDAVIGNFDDVTLTSRGITYRLQRRGDEYWIEMPDPDWAADLKASGRNPDLVPVADMPRAWKQVVMTTGSHRMQTAWVGSERDGGLHNVPFIWLKDHDRWVPREDIFLRPPDAPRQFGTWHDNCIECHATASDPVPASGPPWEPQVAELGIACEACHGPADAHIAKHQNPVARWQASSDEVVDDSIVNPARLSARLSAQVCGQCHGMHLFRGAPARAGERYRPGDELAATRIVLRGHIRDLLPEERGDWRTMQRHVELQEPSFLRDRFWPDGMVRVSGRDYNAMTASACFLGGDLSCLSCHAMHGYEQPAHQMAAGMHGDQACLQCHADIAADIPAHTHHPIDSAGSACLDCHMPRTVYGLATAIRSHHIDAPSVASDLEAGRPNACSLCHMDQSLGWVQEHLVSWYGQAPRPLDEPQQTVSAGVRYAVTGDAGQRAIMAWHLGWGPAQAASGAGGGGDTGGRAGGDAGGHAGSGLRWTSAILAHLLDDPYACVRKIAGDGLQRDPTFADFAYDYVASRAQHALDREAALQRWEAAAMAAVGNGEVMQAGDGADGFGADAAAAAARRHAILVGPDGALWRARLMELMRQRDDRPVDLRE